MKQVISLLILLITSLSLQSCSSDDANDSSSKLEVKVNGIARKFTNIEVATEVYEEYSDYIITAVQSDDATKTIQISLGKDYTGSDSIYFIQYYDGTTYYQRSSPNLSTNVSESSDSRIKGVFSGILLDDDAGTINLSNGVINLKL